MTGTLQNYDSIKGYGTLNLPTHSGGSVHSNKSIRSRPTAQSDWKTRSGTTAHLHTTTTRSHLSAHSPLSTHSISAAPVVGSGSLRNYGTTSTRRLAQSIRHSVHTTRFSYAALSSKCDSLRNYGTLSGSGSLHTSGILQIYDSLPSHGTFGLIGKEGWAARRHPPPRASMRSLHLFGTLRGNGSLNLPTGSSAARSCACGPDAPTGTARAPPTQADGGRPRDSARGTT